MTKNALSVNHVLGWMDSLADATRLRLLRLLERRELGVAELCDVLQLPQSTVSRHLKVLADRHWVQSRRQGTNRLYRVLPDELDPAARKLWNLAREQTDAWPSVRQDQLRLDRLLAQKQNDSQAFFAGAAAQWDKLRIELYGRHITSAAILALLPSSWIIADLGCGTAPLAAQLAPHVKRVIAIDNSAAMLRAARKRIAQFKNVELRQGDLAALPIKDQSCDAALLILALTYVPDPLAALRELSRILKPTGRAVIIDLLPHDREDFRRQMGQQSMGFSPDELTHLAAAAGLTALAIAPLAPEPGAKGPALFLATATRA